MIRFVVREPCRKSQLWLGTPTHQTMTWESSLAIGIAEVRS